MASSSKTYTRQQLQKRLGDKSERTIRRMQRRGHRHFLPPPDKGDRWSEDYLCDIERGWHDADERRAFMRGKRIVPADGVQRLTGWISSGYGRRVVEAWNRQEGAHEEAPETQE
jgi:hypothetical protein